MFTGLCFCSITQVQSSYFWKHNFAVYLNVQQREEQITQLQPDQGAQTGIVPGLEEEEEEDQEMENAKKNFNVR